MYPLKMYLAIFAVAYILIGCQPDTVSVRPNDEFIKSFISENNINVAEIVKYKQYTAIAFRNDREVGLYLDQSGNGRFSKHWENIEGNVSPKRFIGGFNDKYLVEYIIDEDILNQIHTYKTKEGTFKKEPNQKCFVFPTGTGGITYVDHNNKPIII
ncbi:hypothetical protein [Paenibacillus sp. H1-7]|uniref:hypothetical protein n=1 Tax=Paenibacillus sp. H1-7 TaxID=2282849 RepID=UPI001EF7DB65|nr:hypothetical protein [Paenibacillus sp. H1-7]